MRETQLSHLNVYPMFRITPAYAGNTHYNTNERLVSWDHPRVCGKHAYLIPYRNHGKGSPPRMRETPVLLINSLSPYRITPAYAGNTQHSKRDRNRPEDHPRVCGKHKYKKTGKSTRRGSPPRMRETRLITFSAMLFLRITPAYAGNTKLGPQRQHARGDHPRVCGKHWQFARHMIHALGSPPRMRETRKR